MSALPVRGQAVQAPIVTAPKAVPRVSANHVAPRPRQAATRKARNDPNRRRTLGPNNPAQVQRLAGRRMRTLLLVAFSTENRCPLFRKMLQARIEHSRGGEINCRAPAAGDRRRTRTPR